jgi:hypothetical protein
VSHPRLTRQQPMAAWTAFRWAHHPFACVGADQLADNGHGLYFKSADGRKLAGTWGC